MGMEKQSVQDLFFNWFLASSYTITYIVLWFQSLDQWYLPAGLRFAALLCTYPRRWGYLWISEVAAILFLRHGLVYLNGPAWFFCSPAALMPATAIIVWLIKSRTNAPTTTKASDAVWLLSGAFAAALLSKLTVLATNYWLALPYAQANAPVRVHAIMSQVHRFGVMCLGDFLGIMFVVPLIVLLHNSNRRSFHKWARPSVAWTAPAFLALMALVATVENDLRLIACYVMFAPAAWLTIKLHWRGAVIGTVAANFGIAMAMKHPSAMGATDHAILSVQIILAVFSTILLALAI